MKRIEASPVAYTVVSKAAKDFPVDVRAIFWPELRPRLVHPVLRAAGSDFTVVPYEARPEAEALLKQAEQRFSEKDFDYAAALYEKAAAADPSFTAPLLFRGDCDFAKKNYQGALAFYDKAIAVNPLDYHAYLFKGDALVHMGRLAEGRDALATALSLSPRNEGLLKMIRRSEKELHVQLQPDLLSPQVLARQVDTGVEVAILDSAASPHWLAWGLCKALWIGEKSHRLEMTGTESRTFSMEEEVECLGSLLSVYDANKAERGANPFLDRLLEVVRDGLADAFVTYELGTRVDPQLMLTLDEAGRARVKQYVLKYVLSAGELQ